MNKRIMAGISAGVLICSMWIGQAQAATDESSATNPPLAVGRQLFNGKGGAHKELTDAQKTEREAARAQREEKLNDFLQTLSSEQKALYDAAMPAQTQSTQTQPNQWRDREKPDEAAMTARKEKQEAFVASLSETQKAAYDELFGKKGRPSKEQTDAQKAEMEAARDAFLQTLTDEQKELYDAMKPAIKSAEGEKPEKHDEAAMAEMKAKRDEFIASLSEAQKTAYQELTKTMRPHSKSAQ